MVHLKWVFQIQNFHMINKPLAEIKVVFIERLPIKISPQKSLFIELATKILAAKKSNPNADTTTLETEIDQLVYQLYNLTEEEIKIVEEQIT